MTENLEFERVRGLFVTGTDTGVGKTLLAGAIARRLSTLGEHVGVFKPISTGCRWEREGLVSSDAEFLAHCSNSECALEQISPIRYHQATAPLVAAGQSKRQVDWESLQEAYHYVARNSSIVVVEGIGGVMVPITRDYLVLDLMAALALPVVIVAPSRLGTINHTLLTLAQCRSRGLVIAGVVINAYEVEVATLAEETNPQVLAEVGQVKVLTVMPYDARSCVERGQLGQNTLSAVALVNWVELAEEGC